MNKNSILGLVLTLVVAGGIYLLTVKKEDGVPTTVIQSPVIVDGTPKPDGAPNNLPIEPAAAEARKQLAAKINVTESSIVILQITDTTWNDGCLGLGGPAESCMQALVPGFRVELLAQGKTYIYRTDKAGATVRFEKIAQS